jgi:hypothetical protein
MNKSDLIIVGVVVVVAVCHGGDVAHWVIRLLFGVVRLDQCSLLALLFVDTISMGTGLSWRSGARLCEWRRLSPAT